MSKYDPQRDQPRRRPADDEPAPVDALLGEGATRSGGIVDADSVPDVPDAVTEVTVDPLPYAPAPPEQEPSVHVHPSVPAHDHATHGEHVHGEHCEHDHGPGPLARLLSTVAVAAGAVFALRWWRRRRAG